MTAEHANPARPRDYRYSLRTIFIVTAIVAIPLALISYAIQRRNAWLTEVARRAEQDKVTVRQIVIDVDSACEKLGRTPVDETELELHLGRKMPNVHDNGRPTPINYFRLNDDSYMLQYELWATDDWIYNSNNPAAGWVQHFY